MAKTWTSPSNEFSFICYLFTLHVNPDKADFSSLEKLDLDWNEVLRLVEQHRLWASARVFVRGENAKKASQSFIDTVEREYINKRMRNLRLMGSLQMIAKLFDEANIPFTVLKGPLLSLKLYGDLNTRFSNDIDILVDKKHIRDAHDVLLKNDFLPMKATGYIEYGDIHFLSMKDLMYQCDKEFRLEIHQRLDNNPSILNLENFTIDELTEKQTYCGYTYRVLRTDFLFIYAFMVLDIIGIAYFG